MKKYELTEEYYKAFDRYLYRIKSLINFSDVKVGDFGGFVEKESNLSHSGNCWIYDDAKVFGNSLVCENAIISENAQIFGNAKIYGDSNIFGNVKIYNNAKVYGNSAIFDNAKIYKNAEICGDFSIFGDIEITEKCTKLPINLTGYIYTIVITDHHLRIGCECHSFKQWLNFSEEEIFEMDPSAKSFYKEHGNFIKHLIKNL